MLDRAADATASIPPARRGHPAARRLLQVERLVRQEGLSGLADRLRFKLADGIRPATRRLPVRIADVLAADLSVPFTPPVPPLKPGEPIRLNWVMTGPAPGSGGHATIFRMIRHLEGAGYRNRIYLYDPDLVDDAKYAGIIRDNFGFAGPVARLAGEMAPAHGVFATGWPSAYAVFNAPTPGRRFYFVQDFEPDFYPASAERILAENTYRMGFHAITAGRWLSRRLRDDYAMPADPFEFGCDTARYVHRGRPRKGIAYYARHETPRRGYELGIIALELFARRRPDIDIHLYGAKTGRLGFRTVDHGVATPDQLDAIYNSCFAALSLSLTNVSLVPLEMLAAGCIPVVNDAPQNRLVLDNPHVRYAPPTPQALAAALEEIVAAPDFAQRSRAAAESQRGRNWDEAGRAVDAAIRRALATVAPAEAEAVGP